MYSDLVDELIDLDDDSLTERFRALELNRRRDAAEMAAITREGERRQIQAVDGHRSIKQWVRAQTNCPAGEAAGLKRLAAALDDLPGVGDALLAGHIGIAHAQELARVRSNPRCGDQLESVVSILLEHAEHLSYEDFRIVTRQWETLADLDGAQDDHDASHERRTASVIELNGSLDIRASGGSGMATAEVITIFQRFVQAEFDKDVAARTRLFGPDAPASALPRTDAQRRFDAMTEIFRAAVVAPADGLRPEPVVNLVVGVATLERLLARRGMGLESDGLDASHLQVERMETSTGIPVSPDDVIAATLSGVVRRVVIDSADVVVNAGRKRRLFTGVAREMALLLWPHCGHLACTVPSGQCDIDHLDEWEADGGATDQANGLPRCSTHNPWKSKHRLRTRRDQGGRLVDIRADGTPMIPVGRRIVMPTDDALPDVVEHEHGVEVLEQAGYKLHCAEYGDILKNSREESAMLRARLRARHRRSCVAATSDRPLASGESSVRE